MQVDFRLNRQLWMFLAVAEEGHFGRAAERLGMTQPPLSEHIKTLEAALGVTLFDRSRRGTKLTAAGVALLPAARKFMDQVADLERTVREVAAGQSGILNVGAITSAMTDIIPQWMCSLREALPHLTVSIHEIDSVEAAPGLISGALDMAFYRLDGAPGDGLDAFPVTFDKLWVAMPADHPDAGAEQVPLSDIADSPLVMSSRKVSPVYFDSIVSACRLHGLSPRILHEVRSISSQLAYVSCGQGLALVPGSMRRLAPENVRVAPLAEDISIVTTAVAWPANRHAPMTDQAVDVLRSLMSEEYQASEHES
ncbi:LysR substrate-binding domain-containing protein [Ruegeria sp. R14_0]|uniref:LysR family transcriptional regulator n=1 Tax=Ruegeria sp. R14_0 TaxID=2821100 RepID=UPI001ADAEFC8|nr:LysR substrate-binding domain-containing protein [Ruegeria sp. R14_0]MBO9447436.1 LysR family transcriptional regulator [Ruegeria sp. R14_0]